MRGVYGYVATYAAGESAVLTLLAQDRVNVGRLHLEGRRAGARIGELVDAWEAKAREAKAAAPPVRAPAKTPAKAPVRTPAKPPIVRTRSARGSATTNARTTTES